MGLVRRGSAGGGAGGGDTSVTPTSVTNAFGCATQTQLDQIKTYLNISGFNASCYDFKAIQENPPDINNKILDAGTDDV